MRTFKKSIYNELRCDLEYSVITQAALHYSRVFETSSHARCIWSGNGWSRLTFACHNPTGFINKPRGSGQHPPVRAAGVQHFGLPMRQ